MRHPFIASFDGPDLRAIARLVLEWPCYAERPWMFTVDGMRSPFEPDQAERPTPDDWRCRLVEVGDGFAEWSGEDASKREELRVGVAAGRAVTVLAPSQFETAEEALALITPLPFTLASLGSVFPDEWRDLDRRTFGFGNSQTSLGWGCAFRGAGHNRLVSRRWLDFGPWRVLRGPDDLTLVQFHDLALTDPEAALAQALPGQERIGISYISGFIQGPAVSGQGVKYAVLEKLPEGLYDARTRTLEVVVAMGQTISPEAMQDACAYRLNLRAHRTTPIDRIAYVFFTEADARAHLHELWLRELEVWTVDGGEKRRLDLDYHPVPSPPAWVRDVEERQRAL